MKKIIALALVAISSGTLLFPGSTKRQVPVSSQSASSSFTIPVGIKAERFDAVAEANYITAGSNSTFDLTSVEDLLVRCQQTQTELEAFDSKDEQISTDLKNTIGSVQAVVTMSKTSEYKRGYVNGAEGCVKKMIEASNNAVDFMRPNVLTTTWFGRHRVALGTAMTALLLAGVGYYHKDAISNWCSSK